jgi:serine/threonine protein kinase
VQCKLPEGESIRIGIPAETSVAVKKLRQAAIVDTYERELQVMCRMRHVNLVQLLAYCRDEIEHSQGRKEKVEILIFEYMKNGNLDSYIFGMASYLLYAFSMSLNYILEEYPPKSKSK